MNGVKFIGTSSGIAEKERFHSQILLKCCNYNLLIDAPDGCAKALFYANENYNEISGILISHFHPDHISGLASLLQQMKLGKREKPLKIFVHKKLKNSLKKLLALTYIFTEHLNFPLEIIGFDANEVFYPTGNIKVAAFLNNHIKNKYNVRIADVEFVSVSFLIETKYGNFIYTADVGIENDLFVFPEINLDFYITEFTHINENVFQKVLKRYNPRKLIVTHYQKGFEKKHGKSNIVFAEEGDVFTFSL